MTEPDVTAHRQFRAPLGAAKERSGTWSACLLLLIAAACSPGEAVNVTPLIAGRYGGSATAGRSVPVAGGQALPPAAGRQGTTSAGTAPPPTGIAGAAPAAGRGSPPPFPDAGSGGVSGEPTARPPFDPGTDPKRNQIRAGQICQRLSELQCAAEAHCCSAPKKTGAACVQQLTTQCTMQGALDDIAKNEPSGFSTAQTEIVLNKLEMYSQTCDPAVTVWALQADGFRSMFQGTVPPNGTCMPKGLPSTANYGTALASCAQPTTNVCLFKGNGPVAPPQSANCAPRGDVGATCFVDPNCKDGLYCANSQMQYSSGKCQVSKQLGAACTADAECASMSCRSAVCSAQTADTAYCIST